MKGTLADYSIGALSETSIMDIFPYDTEKLEKPKEEPTLLDEVYEDPLFDKAKTFLTDKKTASTSLLQRTYSIGYNRANRLMNELEKAGIVGPFNGASPRRVIANVGVV
jgi:S-DNA-T family DNA segregation ATPase FtsK/SpoIIIE